MNHVNGYVLKNEELHERKISQFKKLLPYLQGNKIDLLDSDVTPLESYTHTLKMMRELKENFDDELGYKIKNDTIVSYTLNISHEFGLDIDPDYYGKGISLINGELFTQFLKSLLIKDLDDDLTKVLEGIVSHLCMLYKYSLVESLQDSKNPKFDKFIELSQFWKTIKEEYERLDISSIRFFSLDAPINALEGGYLKEYSEAVGFLKGSICYDPIHITNVNMRTFLISTQNDKQLVSFLHKIETWSKVVLENKNAQGLIKHILNSIITVLQNDQIYFYSLETEEKLEIISKYNAIIAKIV